MCLCVFSLTEREGNDLEMSFSLSFSLSLTNDFVFFSDFFSFSALCDVYDATNGVNWKVNDNWMDGDPCTQSWVGVICDVTSSSVVYLLVLRMRLE